MYSGTFHLLPQVLRVGEDSRRHVAEHGEDVGGQSSHVDDEAWAKDLSIQKGVD